MAVSISTSYTVATRQALSTSMDAAAIAATKMSTGENIIHAYEDPTGLAIGSNMRAQLDVLEVVKTGIEQTQSMLYIAEAGLKSIYETYTQLNQVLARAKLGYMNDELIQKTLSPTYMQLKQEINRIADSVDFNGQKLFDGTGGTKVAGKESVLDTAGMQYVFSSASQVTVPDLTITNISAKINGSATASDLTITTTNSSLNINGGNTVYEGGNAVSVKGARITITGAQISDGGTPARQATATITLTNVDISLSSVTYNADSLLLSASTPTFDLTSASLSIGNVVSTGTNGINNLSDEALQSTTSTATSLTSTKIDIDDTSKIIPLTGGRSASSSFKFVTGTDLNGSVVEVNFPNLRLTAANGIPGIISTINVADNVSSSVPTDLTNLVSSKDASIDIPYVQKLMDQTVEYLDALGAYQQRFLNINSQLGTAVEQLDLAQGAIMNADLAKQSENFTRDNVKVQVSIAVLNQMNQSLNSLKDLV